MHLAKAKLYRRECLPLFAVRVQFTGIGIQDRVSFVRGPVRHRTRKTSHRLQRRHFVSGLVMMQFPEAVAVSAGPREDIERSHSLWNVQDALRRI